MANDDKAVRNLISVLKDSERGFKDIGEHLKNSEARDHFMQEATVRGSYAQELERAVNQGSGEQVHESGTAAGAVHRIWGDLKANLGGGDKTLLDTGAQGEDHAHQAYQEALQDSSTSDTVRALIAQQAEHVRHSREIVKGLQNSVS